MAPALASLCSCRNTTTAALRSTAVNGHAPAEAGVPAWDSCLTVARAVDYDPGLSTAGAPAALA